MKVIRAAEVAAVRVYLNKGSRIHRRSPTNSIAAELVEGGKEGGRGGREGREGGREEKECERERECGKKAHGSSQF